MDERIPAISFPEVVAELTTILGRHNVAAIGGAKRTSVVADWISAKRTARDPESDARLRFALRLARIIGSRFSKSSVSAWFQGANPDLDDELPIALVAIAPLDEVQMRLLAAARAFVQI